MPVVYATQTKAVCYSSCSKTKGSGRCRQSEVAPSPIRQHQAEQLRPSLQVATTAPFQDTRPLPLEALPHTVLELELDPLASCLYPRKILKSCLFCTPCTLLQYPYLGGT